MARALSMEASGSREVYAPLRAAHPRNQQEDEGWSGQLRSPHRFRRLRLALALSVGAAAAGSLLASASGGTLGHRRRSGAGLRSSQANEAVLLNEECHTAKHGERCHTDVVYAMRHRMLHPEWYIGLNNCSTFADFQAFMHHQVLNSGERRCPKPCADSKGLGHADPSCGGEETGKCHTAVPGDECYSHVLYTKREAIKYPSWYPGLSEESSLIEVQHYLKEENVCPEPCNATTRSFSNDVDGCHSALPGETCFSDIINAKEHFINKHPDWYPGLTNQSSRDKFQAFLHNQHHADAEAARKACPNPCNRPVVEEATLRATCRTAEIRDTCYESVLWGATQGIADHPEWYPGLTPRSAFEDFQMHLHKDNHTKCDSVPCPCHTAAPGERCYGSVLWVLRTGIREHPKTFEGLSSRSSLQEVQQHLHEDDPSAACGRPCASFDADPRSPWRRTFPGVSGSVI